ncbi:MAG: hypothetical protein GF409_00020 [Candidatus Omnitrophica bacterium]|nr:hypothetical protein [Candidatus Omnitrophota bacterium]
MKSRNILYITFLALFLFRVLPSSAGTIPANIKKVAVVEFKGPGSSGEYAEADLVSQILDSGLYTVVERQKLDQVLKEQGMVAADFVDTRKIQKIGKILGVDAIIFGNVNTFKVEDDKGTKPVEKVHKEWVEKKYHTAGGQEKYRKQLQKTPYYVNEPYLYRRGTVSVSYKMIDIKNGTVITQNLLTESYNSANAKPVKKLFGGVNYEPLKPEEVPAKEAVLDMLLEKVTRQFVSYLKENTYRKNKYMAKNKVRKITKPVELTRSCANGRTMKIKDLEFFGGVDGPEYASKSFKPGQKVWLTFKIINYKQTSKGEIWIKEDLLLEDPEGGLIMVRLNILDLHKVYPKDLDNEPLPVKNDIKLPDDAVKGRYKVKIRVLDNIVIDADVEEERIYVE